MSQVNTPYPSTAYLTGFLRSKGISAEQVDLSLELFLRVFTRGFFQNIYDEVKLPKESFLSQHRGSILGKIDSVIAFLQGRDPSVAFHFSELGVLPLGELGSKALQNFRAFAEEGEELDWAFGSAGIGDRAKFLCSLFVDDLAGDLALFVDPRFQLSRYGEKLASSQPDFGVILNELKRETLITQELQKLVDTFILSQAPDVVGLTVPFPGNVYAAFLIAACVRKHMPHCQVILGGGYVNTELGSLEDKRVFDFVHAITFDDGERPFLNVLKNLEEKGTLVGSMPLVRTMTSEHMALLPVTGPNTHDFPHKESPGPSYDGLALDRYVSLLEVINPMHRFWSDGKWIKLMIAHGCYWKKCRFCDLGLDYIARYEPSHAVTIVDQMERLVQATGVRGFHLVDEAAPPALLKQIAEELLKRNLCIQWWGNIRFEKSFDQKLCELLKASGFLAVTGGLEVASDRLLKLMNKGVSVEQVAQVTKNFSDAGILAHAYLMYGFPSETVQETVDSLEMVRQLFENGCLQSAFWHRFSATCHSPIGKNPDDYGIRLKERKHSPLFARNDLPFEDTTGVEHGVLGEGLNRALYNFMYGIGLDQDVRSWFTIKVPKTTIKKDFIAKALKYAKK